MPTIAQLNPAEKVRKDAVEKRYGCVIDADVATLMVHDPEQPLLVRYGKGRRIVRADQVPDLEAEIEANDDHIRDVSLPVGDPAFLKYKIGCD